MERERFVSRGMNAFEWLTSGDIFARSLIIISCQLEHSEWNWEGEREKAEFIMDMNENIKSIRK